MAKKQKQDRIKEKEEPKVGFDYLDGETLADIAAQKDRNGDMTPEACVAFWELARRSGYDVGR